MQKKNLYFIIFIVLIAAMLGGGYFVVNKGKLISKNNNLSISKTQDTIILSKTKSLEFLTDAAGMTLYHDTQDWPKQMKAPYSPYSKCVDACSVTWPPFYTDNIKISAPLKTDDFTVFTRPDGQKQIAWRGWPLYYYSGDTKPGDINGQNIGNIWYAGIAPE